MRISTLAIAAACVIGSSLPVLAQPSKSVPVAEQLMKALEQHNLTFLAAKDPAEEGRYVAAMRLGTSQLLLVSARYTQPVLMNERLLKKDFEGAYRELNAGAVQDGKLFIQDLAQPGLRMDREKDQPFDVAYESVDHRTAFDGDWTAQNLTREAYESAFTRIDERYAHALEALIGSLTTGGNGP